MWPPNSPELNPIDYNCVWGLMQERVYKTEMRDTADLKQRLFDTWLNIPQTVIDEAIDEWRLLRACMRQSKGTSLQTLPVTYRLFS